MDTTMLALIISFAFFLIKGGHSTTFTFQNSCPYPVWPATQQGGSSPPLSQTGFELPSGSTPVSLTAPAGWKGRFWARNQCSCDATGKFTCLSGDCGTGQIACNGAGGTTPTTLVEFTLNGYSGKDFYDTSLVDGFNVPVSVTPLGGSRLCRSTGCPVDIIARCPHELWAAAPNGYVVGCKSACLAFNTDQDCCRGAYGSPTTCRPSRYADMFKSACPQASSYAYDGKTSTFTCYEAAGYLIKFCP